MDAAFWHARWEANQIGFHQPQINSYLQNEWQHLDVAAGAQVLVPLCGKSQDILWLLEQGYQVLGVEISPLAVDAFFNENRLQAQRSQQGAFEVWEQDELRILCGDFFALQAQDLAKVAAVYDRAALIALPPEMRLQYSGLLSQLLPCTAKMLLVCMEYPQTERKGPPFSVDSIEVHELYAHRFSIEQVLREDILAQEPAFQGKVSELYEAVYRLL